MPDLVEHLHRYADAAAATVEEVDLQRVQRRPGRRRLGRVLVAAAVVLGVVGTTLVILDRSEDPEVVTVDPTTPTSVEPPTTDEGTATTIAEQSTYRGFPVAVLTDTEYLVWAGEAGSEEAIRADGFAIDIASGAVREIPPAPIVARSGAIGVWTGSELIVCCGTGRADGYGNDTQSAAAWNPETGDWRTLAPPPASIARSYPAAVWTGTRMIVIAKGPAAAEYDPAADAWTEIEPPPIRGRLPIAAWTGTEVVVWDPVYAGIPSGVVYDRGWRWAPGTDGWTELPTLPEGSRTRYGDMAWTGTDLVVWGLSTTDDALGVGARWRPGDNGWTPMTPSPQGPVPDPFNGTPGSQTVASVGDGRVVVKPLDGGESAAEIQETKRLLVYDPGVDRWTTTALMVPGYSPLLLVAGNRVFVADRAQPLVGNLPAR